MRGYKFCLYKAYFDKGYGLTSYIKYFLAFISLASKDLPVIFIMGIGYGIFCFFLGWGWYHYNFIEAENEVGNRYNPFVKEMRKSVNRKT